MMKGEAEGHYGLLGNSRANTLQTAIDTVDRLEDELAAAREALAVCEQAHGVGVPDA